jgi:hypothetical protein
MEHLQVAQRDPLVSPACEVCGFGTRLVGLEPDLVKERTDLCTYQCNHCGAVQTRPMRRPPNTRRGTR